MDEWHSAIHEQYTIDMSIDGTRRLVVESYARGGDVKVRFAWNRIGNVP